MTKKEIEKINAAAKGSDLKTAARDFLGLAKDDASNSAAAVNGIVDEVTQWNEADAETRAGIDAYKAAKDTSGDDVPAVPRPSGKTRAKSKE